MMDKDFEFLRNQLKLSEYLMVSIKELVQNNIKLSNADFDNIHDQCMEYLQTFGFDDQYQLTEHGQSIQHIIDKIFDLQKVTNQ
jgi:hypothetical protein